MRLEKIVRLTLLPLLSLNLVVCDSVKVVSTLFGHDSFIYQDQLYVVGGVSEPSGSLSQPIKIPLNKDLDLASSNEYQQLQGSTDNTLPPSLEGTKVVLDSNNGKFYMVGGKSLDYKKGQVEGKIVFRSFDFKDNRWVDLGLNMKALPSERYLHSLIYINNQILLMGGKSLNGTITYNDVWSFRVGSDGWEQKGPTGATFEARYGHAVAPISDSKFVILGGATVKDKDFRAANINEMLVYDSKDNTISKETLKSADSPTDRIAFTLNAVDGKLYLIGGTARDGGARLNDIFSLDYQKFDWAKIKLDSSTLLLGRSYHSAQTYGKSIIMTYGCDSEVASGGIQVFKPDSNELFSKFTPAMKNSGAVSGTNIGAIVGGVVGGLALIAIVVGLLFYRRKRLNQQRAATAHTYQNNDSFTAPEEVGIDVLSNYASDAPINAFTDLGSSGKFSTGIWSSGTSNIPNSTQDSSIDYRTTESKFIPGHTVTNSNNSNIDIHVDIGGPTPNTNFNHRVETNMQSSRPNQFGSSYGTSNIDDVKLFN